MVEATSAIGQEHTDNRKAIGTPFSLKASVESSATWCAHGGTDPSCFPICSQSASSAVEIAGSTRTVLASIELHENHGGSGACLFGGPAVTSGSVRVMATTDGPVYRTVASDLLAPYRRGGTFAESVITRSDTGAIDDLFVGPGPIEGSPDGSLPNTGLKQIVAWSVGGPAGSATAPLEPVSVLSGLQLFTEPTPGDAAKDGGLRYQQPLIDPNYMILGFDLAAAESNPFTAFRFPEVPAGADNRFILAFGDTEIAGLTGETVNLRQYARDGYSALSLRGDLTAFLPAAAAPNAAIPIGGPPPQLTFGLAFANPGISSFTLKPVPEPATCLLGAVGAVVVFLCWRSRSSRLLAVAASCLLVGTPLSAAIINMSVFLDANGVIDPRGPGPQDDSPIVTASAARGVGVFELDTTTNVLSYEILFTDQLLAGSEIGADLRAPDSTADVLFPLPLGHFAGGVTPALAPEQVASLMAGYWLLTIRTTAFPAGEIGGYIQTAPEPTGLRLAVFALVLFAAGRRLSIRRESSST